MKLTNPKTSLLLGGVASALLLASANAAVIYSQAFDAPSAAAINTTAVSVSSGTLGGTSGALWKANTGYQSNGTLSASTRSMALLAFTPAAGNIYELTLTIDNLAGGFIGIGFADDKTFALGNTNNDRMITSATSTADNYGMMFLTAASLATTGMGYSTYNGATILDNNVTLGQPTTNLGPFTLKIVMDTTNTNWTTEYFVDNSSVEFVTHTGSLSNIDSVGINTGVATTATTFSNFQLQTIPEPGAALLGSLGMLALLRRRRA